MIFHKNSLHIKTVFFIIIITAYIFVPLLGTGLFWELEGSGRSLIGNFTLFIELLHFVHLTMSFRVIGNLWIHEKHYHFHKILKDEVVLVNNEVTSSDIHELCTQKWLLPNWAYCTKPKITRPEIRDLHCKNYTSFMTIFIVLISAVKRPTASSLPSSCLD